MFSRNNLFKAFALLILASMVLVACGGGAVETVIVEKEVPGGVETVVVEVEPEVEQVVTMDGYSTTDIPELDPQLTTDQVSISYIENLFVHLTNFDLVTSEIVGEAATSWTTSEDGLTWTFTLRTDIPWVYHNPVTGETTQEVDADGNPLFVTAEDFVYAIKRACDPTVGAAYGGLIAPFIKGCTDHITADDFSQELDDAVGVSAPAPDTLVFELEFPAGYFLSLTPMWVMAATPSWAIAEHGEAWTEAGNIVTNGRYVLSEWVHGVRRIIVRNPLMPADMQGGGNIEKIVINVVPDTSTGYALWLNNEVETSGVPAAELEAFLEQYPDEADQISDLAVFYMGFRSSKAPVDDPMVRQALAQAIDKEAFIEVVLQGQGVPMIHFTPPGLFGAPAIDEVGVGYDPAAAQQLLADAGYPNCEGFPQTSVLGYSGQSTLDWLTFVTGQWETNLGCSADLFTIEQQSFGELLDTVSEEAPDDQVPSLWTLGWGPDYADANNFVGDVLRCDVSDWGFNRECNAIDDMITAARVEPDPAVRIDLYTQIEEAFFGDGGEHPIIPLWLRIAYTARHSWLDRIPSTFGGEQWYTWNIDWEAKMAAQGQ